MLLQQLLNGVVLGSIYTLIALGLTMIFGILDITNFAHGESFMLGAFMSLFCFKVFGLSFFPSMIISMVIVTMVTADIVLRLIGLITHVDYIT